MVGSRQGWREAPYVDCPADTGAISRGLLAFDSEVGRIHLVPGVIQRGPLPNVLRGEETQIVGALARDPALAAESLMVLPGTHSKWVRVRDGRMTSFDTFMTGELFSVLREHSLLGKPASEVDPNAITADAKATAFSRGLATARESGCQGVAGRLFSARSLFLTGALHPAATLDYLSGLLVGEEIRSAVAADRGRPMPAIVLIGDAALCGRYRDAFESFGMMGIRVFGDSAAAGLWSAPGVATPTEGFAALDAGADMLKLFPAEQLGPSVIRAWRAVLPRNVPLVPVGGVSAESMAAFIAARADGFGLGSAVYKPGMTITDVRRAADTLVATYRGCPPP